MNEWIYEYKEKRMNRIEWERMNEWKKERKKEE